MSPTPMTSLQNALFRKQQRILSDSRYRRSEKLAWIEGEKIILELKREQIEALFVGPDFPDRNWSVPPYQLSKELSKRAFVTQTPQEVGAIIRFPEHHLEAIRSSDNILVLDNLQDPGNIGTLIRSAAAFNFSAVVLADSVDPSNPKLLRATSGAFQSVTLISTSVSDIQNFCHKSKRHAMIARQVDNHETNKFPNAPFTIVIGSEARGPDTNWQGTSWWLPLKNDVDSLNAAIAGSILMKELALNS